MPKDSRGVIWARVSTEDQKSGYSLDAQERLLNEFAAARGVEVVRTFNVSESASTASKRRQFKEMMAFLEKEGVPFLIAEKTDRLTRNIHDLARIHELMRKGLTVQLYREGIEIDDNSDPSVHLTFHIIASVASYIAANIGREARKGMKEKALQGGLPFKCPVGYAPAEDPKDQSRRTVVVDPERAPLVKRAFELYASGSHSLSTLRDLLEKEGLTTRPSLSWTKSGGKAGKPPGPVNVQGLQKILRNPFYHGEVRWKDVVSKGRHEPLVGKELFNLVQARLGFNRTYVKPAAKKDFLFKKYLRCGGCWSTIRAIEQEGAHKSGRYVYYYCPKAKNPKCVQRHYREEKIEEIVVEALGGLCVDEELADAIKARLRSAHAEQTAGEEREARRLQKELARRKKHLGLVYDDRLREVISVDLYKAKSGEIQTEIDRIEADLRTLGTRNLGYKEEGSTILELLRGVKDAYLAQDQEGKAKILDVVLDKIVLRGNQTFVQWREPFQRLFDLNRVIQKSSWGE